MNDNNSRRKVDVRKTVAHRITKLSLIRINNELNSLVGSHGEELPREVVDDMQGVVRTLDKTARKLKA